MFSHQLLQVKNPENVVQILRINFKKQTRNVGSDLPTNNEKVEGHNSPVNISKKNWGTGLETKLWGQILVERAIIIIFSVS